MDASETLTPAEREAVQLHWLRRWLARKVSRGTRRQTDHPPPVKRYDLTGHLVGAPVERKRISQWPRGRSAGLVKTRRYEKGRPSGS